MKSIGKWSDAPITANYEEFRGFASLSISDVGTCVATILLAIALAPQFIFKRLRRKYLSNIERNSNTIKNDCF